LSRLRLRAFNRRSSLPSLDHRIAGNSVAALDAKHLQQLIIMVVMG
jgi:hypothetical protein